MFTPSIASFMWNCTTSCKSFRSTSPDISDCRRLWVWNWNDGAGARSSMKVDMMMDIARHASSACCMVRHLTVGIEARSWRRNPGRNDCCSKARMRSTGCRAEGSTTSDGYRRICPWRLMSDTSHRSKVRNSSFFWKISWNFDFNFAGIVQLTASSIKREICRKFFVTFN